MALPSPQRLPTTVSPSSRAELGFASVTPPDIFTAWRAGSTA
jgi:hypothetical protein